MSPCHGSCDGQSLDPKIHVKVVRTEETAQSCSLASDTCYAHVSPHIINMYSDGVDDDNNLKINFICNSQVLYNVFLNPCTYKSHLSNNNVLGDLKVSFVFRRFILF